MDQYQSMAGIVSVELTGADLTRSLQKISESGILIFRVRQTSELTASFFISEKDRKALTALCRRNGDTLRIVQRKGLHWHLKAFFHRPVLIICILLLVLEMLFIPTRILFVEVEGNEKIPSRLILEAAAQSGIGFGASRREVRSERMKNQLLSSLPQLQWAGVNTYGCTAVITVRERAEETSVPDNRPASIVAAQDGVILSCTATRGTQLCAIGDAVQAGQVLISGFEDHGRMVHLTRADGEIIAQTRRNLTSLTPAQLLRRGESGQEQVRFCLIIGKKRINFYKGSGICDASCVKMYSEYILTLPGGFELPVMLIKETITEAQLQHVDTNEEHAMSMLKDFTSCYLTDQMIAGQILQREERLSVEGGAISLTGAYACTEMIGRHRQEQIGE